MSRLLPSALLCCSLLAVCGAVGAETLPSGRAADHARQGQHLIDAGKLDARNTDVGCSKFEAAEVAQHSVETLLRLGDCHERAGRNASAWHSYSEASAFARSEGKHDSEGRAQQRIKDLEPKLSRVVFVVPVTSRAPNLTVTLGENTIPPSAWGAIIPVDAGIQHITASAKGYEPWVVDVNVTDGAATEYRVNVPALAPAALSLNPTSRPSPYRTAGLVAGSAGALGIGAGAVLTVLSRNDDRNDGASTCARGVAQCSASQQNRGRDKSSAAAVTLAVGSTLIATGVTLVVLAPAPDKKEAHALRVAARYAGGGGRLQLEGVW